MARLLMICALIFAVACDRPSPPESQTAAQTASQPAAPTQPADVLLAYYAAMSAEKFDVAHAMVNDADRAARSVDELRKSATDPLQLAIIRKRTYEVKDTVIDGDRGRVKIETTGPDIAKLQRVLMAKFASDPDFAAKSDLRTAMKEAVEAPDAPTILTHQTIYFVREDGAWKLDFDWAGEHPHRGVPVQERPEQPGPDTGSR